MAQIQVGFNFTSASTNPPKDGEYLCAYNVSGAPELELSLFTFYKGDWVYMGDEPIPQSVQVVAWAQMENALPCDFLKRGKDLNWPNITDQMLWTRQQHFLEVVRCMPAPVVAQVLEYAPRLEPFDSMVVNCVPGFYAAITNVGKGVEVHIVMSTQHGWQWVMPFDEFKEYASERKE